ncbi:ABC transporter permease [Aquabacterium sp. A7-Y]|uniref:MlaE family ABC transporter permease n=1 Tax=Aquabacterium sp. A7-Y TaxID=1349605 RepID=UPI00223D6776|nr:ABC transporter permease [Aquabacterium sp. A7-Y]MCW7536634.1 ABC transporter permease [Aquabacterium sp. A7-Y]
MGGRDCRHNAAMRRLASLFAPLIPVRPVSFLGAVMLSTGPALRGRWHFRMRDLARVTADSGARALPIVTVVNVLVGAILAFVGAVQLVKFGAGIFVADLVGIAVSREMAAVITAVVMAGRTGAAFAAELATMQTNEEVDALEVLGLHAIDYLVLPRVIALLLMMPLLYVYGCLTGLIGGLLVGVSMLELAPAAYLDRSFEALTWGHLGLGFAKSIVFGGLVAITGCYFGLFSQRNAAGVGAATTRAVVVSIVGIISLDAVFAVCANALGV